MPVQLNGADLITSFSDYEEGTFTPQLVDASNDGTGECQVYATQVGRYTKMGNRVFFQLTISITSVGNLSTTQTSGIIGLPFTTSAAASSDCSICIGFASSLAIAAESTVTGVIQPNSVKIILQLWDVVTGVSGLRIDEVTDGGLLQITGILEI